MKRSKLHTSMWHCHFLTRALCSHVTKYLLISGGLFAATYSQVALGVESAKALTAESVFYQMLESTLTGENVDQKVLGTDGKVTFGAEKEGSSSLITRVMGPNKTETKNYFDTYLSTENRAILMKHLLSKWLAGSYRVKNVTDISGQPQTIAFSDWTSSKVNKLDDVKIVEVFYQWLELAGDRWFSHLTPSVRRKLYNGELPGQTSKTAFGRVIKKNSNTRFGAWLPLYGLPEKYITNAHNTSVGWEINFNPMPNFGEFIALQEWFSESLRNAGEDFGLPGHQRLVFPARTKGDLDAIKSSEGKLSEIYKNVQAFIVLKGQEGHSGMEVANYKSASPDSSFYDLTDTGRNILRLEKDRFGKDTYGLEIRGGTKTKSTQRFVQMVIASRYSTNDFSGISDVRSWELIKYDLINEDEAMARFGLPRKIVRDAINNIRSAQVSVRESTRSIDTSFLTPFWWWENAPYLSKEKKAAIKELSKTFIISAAAWKSPSVHHVLDALQTFALSSNLTADIKHYISPTYSHADDLNSIVEWKSESNSKEVDVNKVDLGIEYTARYPIKLAAEYSKGNLKTQTYGWKRTEYDLTHDERKSVLEKVAKSLSKELGGDPKEVEFSAESTHGNSLEMAYELKDKLGRTLRVEWDGIGRDYDPEGKVIAGSVRGGHIEVVTPKFVPMAEDIKAIFKVFNKFNLVPSSKSGGGHINIDLAPFEGKPEALARFITLFTNNRGIISLLFQHPQRLRSAEPVELSPEVGGALAGFKGSDEELKQLLYNNRYFNTRLGRKTRYIQMDLSAYFQDVIPDHLIQKDFDIKNDPWRRNFNVEPKVRKIEFRLFNAPSDETEAALQIRLVRAMMDFALNRTEAELEWQPQVVDYEAYVKDPTLAFEDLNRLAETLGLEAAAYRSQLVEGLATSEVYLQSSVYQPLSQQLRSFPRQEGWGEAVSARTEQNAISAENRLLPIDDSMLSADSHRLLNERREDSRRMQKIRETEQSEGVRTGEITRDHLSEFIDSVVSLPNRGNLPPDDRLRIIYSHLKGDKSVKANKALKQWVERSNAFLKLSLEERKKLAGKSNVQQTAWLDLETAISNGLKTARSEYSEWLLSLIDLKWHFSPMIVVAMLNHSEEKIVARGAEIFKTQPQEVLEKELGRSIGKIGQLGLNSILEKLRLFDQTKMNESDKSNIGYWLATQLEAYPDKVRNAKEVEQVSNIVGLMVEYKYIGNYFSRNDKSARLAANNLDFAKTFVRYLEQSEDTKIPTLASGLVRSSDKEVQKYGWKLLYEKFIPHLKSENKEKRQMALLYLEESDDVDFVLKVMTAANMLDSKNKDVRDDFLKFFESRIEEAYALNSKILNRIKSVLTQEKDSDESEFFIKVLSHTDNEVLANLVVELMKNSDVHVQRRVSRIFKDYRNSSSLIYEAAFSAILNPDAIVSQNAEALYHEKYLSYQGFLLLMKNLASNQTNEKVLANKLVNKLIGSKTFDSSMSGNIGYQVDFRNQMEEIFRRPDFNGYSSILQVFYRDGALDLRPIAREKIRAMDDFMFVAITQELLGHYWYRNAVKEAIDLILERDLTHADFSYEEYDVYPFYQLEVNDLREKAQAILLKIEVDKLKDKKRFFDSMVGYTRSNEKEVWKVIARLAVKNKNQEGVKPVLQALSDKKDSDIDQILKAASTTSSGEHKAKSESHVKSCQLSLSSN